VENGSENHARDSAISKHEKSKVSTGLLASPHLSDEFTIFQSFLRTVLDPFILQHASF
jgi:hypothetical protein